MTRAELLKTKGESYSIRGIPKGCKYCIKGQKVVLFLNGICQKPDHCSWYCPISKERKNKEITYADEIQVKDYKEILKEISLVKAKGVSITGGEPLAPNNTNKTLDYIIFLKKEMGSDFHIHLYTNGVNFNEQLAQKLSLAGLDEIRFHPSKENWIKIKYALNKSMSVGAEVPVIPDKKNLKTLKEFIFYLDKINCDFINLDEFEMCFPNSESLKSKGFLLKEGTIASVKNSEESALKLIKSVAKKTKLNLHYCPIILKDHYQLKNRYKRRARSIKAPYEVVNNAGLLIYAQIEGTAVSLRKFRDNVISKLNLPKGFYSFKEFKINLPWYIPVYQKFVEELKKYELECYIIEGIPFRDKYFQITEKTPINLINIIKE